ncbi:trace amine-associated receptor 4-like [Chiloscyllium plagiosum]|uniref:trace amine-associated receptor 4-like n=1 Tax=Chiloscyllium plagiosum TaxID=36176 RepID=UPI001CB86DE5|nr:trace amine-associated receptor 4-like [Chiloscyllium plagiosum]
MEQKMNSSYPVMTEHLELCFDFSNTSCPKMARSTTNRAILYVCSLSLILITVLGNLFVIISISHFKQLHTPTYYLVLSLAVTDLLLGLVVLPNSMIYSIETCWYIGNIFCDIHISLSVTLTIASVYHLGFIAVVRYFAVCDPLHYTTKITVPVIITIIIFIWVFSIIYGFGLVCSKIIRKGIEDYIRTVSCHGSCVLVFNKLWGHLNPFIGFLCPTVIIFGIYIKIFIIARRHARVIRNMSRKAQSKEENNNPVKEHKAAMKLGIVIGVYIICWLPYCMTIAVDPHINYSTSRVLFSATLWLGFINSAFNPILYAFFYPWFRKALKLILSCKILNSDSSTINLFPEN